jgi:hypothetical protein
MQSGFRVSKYSLISFALENQGQPEEILKIERVPSIPELAIPGKEDV